jgi:hypothetical protein
MPTTIAENETREITTNPDGVITIPIKVETEVSR